VSDLEGRCFIRRGNHLVPADVHADEMMATIKEGREVIVSIRKARSPKHHRWFFAMLRKVVDATDLWGHTDNLLDDLKHAVGHVARRINVITGRIEIRTKSINFAAMPEPEFVDFRDRCIAEIVQTTGIDSVALMEEVNLTQERTRENSAA